MREPYKEIVKQLYKKAKNFYKNKLVSFVVFGSVARGTTNPYSDIDLLIVSEGLPRGRTKRILDFIKNVEKPLREKLKDLRKSNYFIEISPIIRKPEEIKLGGFIYLDMIEDAIILHDRDNFFKTYLEELKKKLKEYGAKKAYKKGGYYWIIKEDFDFKKGIEI